VDGSGQFLGENAVDAALPRDPALAGEGGSDDLDSEMRLLAAICAAVMAGMEAGIVMDREPRRL
jgi:hypothetical protein